jgi:hypothetical protein
VPAPSDLQRHLVTGAPDLPPGSTSRSYLPDGRCVGWYGPPGVVIDAELVGAEVPDALGRRYGRADFWGRWTRTECAAKAAGIPIARWLRRHGLNGPGTAHARTVVLDGVVVSVAAVPASGGQPEAVPAGADSPGDEEAAGAVAGIQGQ